LTKNESNQKPGKKVEFGVHLAVQHQDLRYTTEVTARQCDNFPNFEYLKKKDFLFANMKWTSLHRWNQLKSSSLVLRGAGYLTQPNIT